MSTLSLFLRSLVLTGIFSFITPWLVVGFGSICLSVARYIPFLREFSEIGTQTTLDILTIFGNGNPIEGLVAIGLTYSLVSMFFEAFASHRYHKW